MRLSIYLTSYKSVDKIKDLLKYLNELSKYLSLYRFLEVNAQVNLINADKAIDEYPYLHVSSISSPVEQHLLCYGFKLHQNLDITYPDLILYLRDDVEFYHPAGVTAKSIFDSIIEFEDNPELAIIKYSNYLSGEYKGFKYENGFMFRVFSPDYVPAIFEKITDDFEEYIIINELMKQYSCGKMSIRVPDWRSTNKLKVEYTPTHYSFITYFSHEFNLDVSLYPRYDSILAEFLDRELQNRFYSGLLNGKVNS